MDRDIYFQEKKRETVFLRWIAKQKKKVISLNRICDVSPEFMWSIGDNLWRIRFYFANCFNQHDICNNWAQRRKISWCSARNLTSPAKREKPETMETHSHWVLLVSEKGSLFIQDNLHAGVIFYVSLQLCSIQTDWNEFRFPERINIVLKYEFNSFEIKAVH